MNRKFHLIKLLVFSLLMALVISGVSAQERVTITWFVGLGTGTQQEQIDRQNEIVEAFNASQDEIELVLNIGASFETSRDTLSTLIAAGTAPDIIGPVGVGGSNAFADQWLDLQPLVDSTGFDLSIFDPALVELYRSEDGELLGIPFAVYPSVTYFNRDLFDEAGLNYPPQNFDEMYVMPDGTEVEWDYDTVAEIAKILTVDANGNDATSEDFDAGNVVQFGLNFQWALLRLIWTDFQPASFYDAASGEVSLPEEWREGTQWLYDAIWTESFVPNNTYSQSELFGTGNNFPSGNLAMSIVPLWYTCCLDGSVGSFEWDLGVVPKSIDGEYHVATDADTFRVSKDTQHPEEAFTVLTYLLTEAVPALSVSYGAYPAHPDYQQLYLDAMFDRYPWEINWEVAAASLAYNNPGPLHHEANFPNWQKGTDRIGSFFTLLTGDTGVDIDVAAELDTLEADLQSIVDEIE